MYSKVFVPMLYLMSQLRNNFECQDISNKSDEEVKDITGFYKPSVILKMQEAVEFSNVSYVTHPDSENIFHAGERVDIDQYNWLESLNDKSNHAIIYRLTNEFIIQKFNFQKSVLEKIYMSKIYKNQNYNFRCLKIQNLSYITYSLSGPQFIFKKIRIISLGSLKKYYKNLIELLKEFDKYDAVFTLWDRYILGYMEEDLETPIISRFQYLCKVGERCHVRRKPQDYKWKSSLLARSEILEKGMETYYIVKPSREWLMYMFIELLDENKKEYIKNKNDSELDRYFLLFKEHLNQYVRELKKENPVGITWRGIEEMVDKLPTERARSPKPTSVATEEKIDNVANEVPQRNSRQTKNMTNADRSRSKSEKNKKNP